MSTPTIYDIAAHAGVGIATVSRVINGSNRVSDKTRAVVQEAMRELGFRPNNAARRLAAGAPNRPRVVALMPFFTTSFYFSVFKPLSQRLSVADMDLVLLNTTGQSDTNRHLDRLLTERSCEAVVVCSTDINEERHSQFANLSIPVAVIDYPATHAPSVTVDNVQGGRMMAKHLAECGVGKQVLVIGTRNAHAFRDRERGFKQEVGDDAPVIELASTTIEAGREVVKRILREHPDIEGIACAADMFAVGVIEEMRALGKRVPDDVQVIGFDDQPLMDVLGITTVRQPMELFGEWAAETVENLLSNNGSEPPPSATLPLTLKRRQTTCSPSVETAENEALGASDPVNTAKPKVVAKASA